MVLLQVRRPERVSAGLSPQAAGKRVRAEKMMDVVDYAVVVVVLGFWLAYCIVTAHYYRRKTKKRIENDSRSS
jgi:cbb3-type cytochrome oxidase subunit 3